MAMPTMSGPNRVWLSALLVGVSFALMSATPARAGEAGAAKLSYTRGPESCPDETAFRGQVMARLGYDPFAADAPESQVDVVVRAAPSGFSATLAIRRDGHTVTKVRDGAGETCAALIETVATTIAMALDPIAASSPSTTRAPRPPEPTPVAPRPPTAPPSAEAPASAPPTAPPSGPPPAPPTAPDAWAGRVGAAFGGGVGELPGASVSGTLAFGLRRARLGLLAEARYAAMAQSFLSAEGDQVDASLLTVGAGPCLEVGSFEGCVHLRVGAWRARSSTVVQPTDRGAVYGEAVVSGRGRIGLATHAEIFGALEIATPLDPISLRVSGGEIWNASPVIARLLIGAAFKVF